MNNNLTNRTFLSHLTLPRIGYMDALLNAARNYHLIEESVITALQAAIIDQLGVCIKSFTKDESSSVTIETADELSAGLAFTLNEYLFSLSDHDKALTMLHTRPLNEIWLDGIRLTKSKSARAMYLCRVAAASRCVIPSKLYNEALDGEIRACILRHDGSYRPHLTNRSFDYPTALDAKLEGRGYDFYINYLSALICENHFCNRYSRGMLIKFHKKCQILNIYTPILLNAVFRRFLRKGGDSLQLEQNDIELICDLFSSCEDEEIASSLHASCDALTNDRKEYHRRVLDEYMKRLILAIRCHSLENLLVIF